VVSIKDRVEKIAGVTTTPRELQGLPRMDTQHQPKENPHPLAPYLCPATRGSHRFQAVNDLGFKCKLCALWMDPAIGYESPLGLAKIEISKDSPKVKAPRGWARAKSAIGWGR
jgi:hypothetical protein